MHFRSSFAILIFVLLYILTIANSQYRIVGGIDSSIQRNPHLVSINDTCGYACVGSLITLQLVVTAAHCFSGLRANTVIRVAAGVTDIRDLPANGQVRDAQHIYVAPGFSYATLHMDIAVIKVREPFYERSTIKTIPLCEATLDPCTEIEVNGWGCTIPDSRNLSPILQYTHMYIIDDNECAALLQTERKALTESMYCARNEVTETCRGDSGAPAVVNGKLCGLVSGGVARNPYFPTTFTKITNANVHAFINSVLRNNLQGVQNRNVILK